MRVRESGNRSIVFWAFVATALLAGGLVRRSASASSAAVSTAKAEQFLRERFGIPDSVQLSFEPFRDSPYAGFDVATVSVGSGKDAKTQEVYVTKEGRYMALGKLFTPTSGNLNAQIVQQVREAFKVPESDVIAIGPLEVSKFAGFRRTKVTVDDGKTKQTQDFFVSSDRRVVVLGALYSMSIDLRARALETMVTSDQPSVGPADAKVTIVEYSDLECPTCARVQDFLDREFLPKYADRVRVIFKEFPLPMHEWSMTAAIANQCAYQINSSTFLAYRSMIYDHQTGIAAANARDALLQYGEEIGLNRLRLAECIDSKASEGRVEENKKEAEKLEVTSTPTFFINGRLLVGMPPDQEFEKMVDQALAAAGK